MPARLSILIVEDHEDGAESLATLLGLHGHKTCIATSCATALAAVAECTPDVVILDIGLPDSDGYVVAKKLCEVSKRRPLLVAVTGHVRLEERSRAEGIDFHFVKPVDPCVLANLLRSHADKIVSESGSAS
jgi:CheY-like chemotaxis protein